MSSAADGTPYREPAEPPPRRRRKKRDDDDLPKRRFWMGATLSFFLPGAVNFYGQHHVLGVSVLLAYGVSLFVAPEGFGFARIVALLLDLLVGVGSVRRCNDDEIWSPGRQFGVGLVICFCTSVCAVTASWLLDL